MREGVRRRAAAARRALEEAALEQVGLVDVLDRVRLLADGDGERRETDRAAAEASRRSSRGSRGRAVEAELVDASRSSAARATVGVDRAVAAHLGVVAHALEQAVGDARRAARAVGDRARAGGVDRDAEDAGASARRSARGRRGRSGRGGAGCRSGRAAAWSAGRRGWWRRSSVNGGRSSVITCAPGALAERDRQLAVLHRGVERLLHRAREPVDLVDEEDRARLERGEEGRDVALALERRAGGLRRTARRALGDDPGELVLPRPGGPESSTWSSASPRAAAAAIETPSCSLSAPGR